MGSGRGLCGKWWRLRGLPLTSFLPRWAKSVPCLSSPASNRKRTVEYCLHLLPLKISFFPLLSRKFFTKDASGPKKAKAASSPCPAIAPYYNGLRPGIRGDRQHRSGPPTPPSADVDQAQDRQVLKCERSSSRQKQNSQGSERSPSSQSHVQG